ncbi:WD40/YVTN repeat-like containing protein [Gracilaria domingensis]|nr:WD40/YVTN repeat-like containing protein [Gracilaria domingensis]
MTAFIPSPLAARRPQTRARAKHRFACSVQPPNHPSNNPSEEGSFSEEPAWNLLQSRISQLREQEVARDRFIARNWRTGNYRASIVASVHNDFVRKLAFHGEFMAFGTASGSVVFSDLVSGYRIRCDNVHDGQVTAIDYRDGYIVSVASLDKKICVWSCAQFEKRAFWSKRVCQRQDVEGELPEPGLTISGHDDVVTCLHINAEKRILYSASVDGTVRLTQLETGETMRTIRVGDPIFSMAVTDKGYILVGCASGKVQAYQADNGLYLLSIHCHRANTTAVDYFEERELLATGDSAGHLSMWSLKDGSQVSSLHRHQAAVMSLQLDGSKLISAARDGCVSVQSVDSSGDHYAICGFTRYIGTVAFDESRLIADGTNDVIVCHRFDFEE